MRSVYMHAVPVHECIYLQYLRHSIRIGCVRSQTRGLGRQEDKEYSHVRETMKGMFKTPYVKN